MHDYDCPCDECRGPATEALFERVLHVVERLEQELARPAMPRPEHEDALAWLDALCGGPGAVTGLDTAPLRGPVALPAHPRVAHVAEILDGLATGFDDPEVGVALRRGLVRVWCADPGLVSAPASASYPAAGIAWAVGEANGVVGADTIVTASRLKQALALPSAPVTYARPIRRALQGLWPWHTAPAPTRPLLPALGHADLLVSRTRGRLIRVRDHALAAQAAARRTT